MAQTQAQAETQERIEKALGWHDPSEEQRDVLVDAVTAAGGLGFFTWDDLSQEGKDVVVALEKTQQTGWDDPADVPDDTPDNF